MSASPMANKNVGTQAIPIKRVVVHDASDLPSHYSETPGGTMFSTTPGGTKIVYERNFLLSLRNSPVSKTPPMYDIPEILTKGSDSQPRKSNNHYNNQRKQSLTNRNRRNSNARKNSIQDDDQFPIEL